MSETCGLACGSVREVLEPQSMRRTPMATVVDEYKKVIRNLHTEETNVRGDEREMIGYIANGIARFLRRRPCSDQTERLALLALADRAEEISMRCLASSHPTGEA
jgi:hypothetical protein